MAKKEIFVDFRRVILILFLKSTDTLPIIFLTQSEPKEWQRNDGFELELVLAHCIGAIFKTTPHNH